MDEFTLYDVEAECRDCGVRFPTKSFKPVEDGEMRWGMCGPCIDAAKARQRALEAPRRAPVAEPPDLEPPRRIWEPD